MYTIILAGGLGKRMNSDIPKVLHKVNGIPMICHVIREAFKLNTKEIMIVVGRYKEIINKTVQLFCSKKECKKVTYIIQEDKTIDEISQFFLLTLQSRKNVNFHKISYTALVVLTGKKRTVHF